MAGAVDAYRRMQREAVPEEASMGTLLRVLTDSILVGRGALAAGDLGKADQHLVAAQQVLIHLRAGVPQSIGELGEDLRDLYAWSELQLGKANIAHDPDLVDAVVRVLGNIRDGFERVQPEAREAAL